jgi:hypothetical protein
MIVTPFDPARDLIVVTATIWGPPGDFREVKVALDTAASETLIIPSITDALGYSARVGDARTVIRSAIGAEPGYMMRVARSPRWALTLSRGDRAHSSDGAVSCFRRGRTL